MSEIYGSWSVGINRKVGSPVQLYHGSYLMAGKSSENVFISIDEFYI